MKQVILVAHGKLAHEMKQSAEMIFGSLPDFASIEFLKEEGLDSISEKITQQVTSNQHEGTLIITDLFCGTPYNASCSVAMRYPDAEIEVLSGMSLPMVLETATLLNAQPLQDTIDRMKELAAETVKSFKEQVIEEEEDF